MQWNSLEMSQEFKQVIAQEIFKAVIDKFLSHLS